MKYNEKLIEAFKHQFSAFGFELAESSIFGVRFQNQAVGLNLCFNDQFLEQSIFLEIEKETSIEILENLLNSVFKVETEIYHSQIDGFIENLHRFFNSEIGQKILQKDKAILQKLKEGYAKLSEEYTQKILLEQDLQQLHSAWQVEDFQKFVEKFETMDSSQVQRSLKMKYQIALKRLNRKSPV